MLGAKAQHDFETYYKLCKAVILNVVHLEFLVVHRLPLILDKMFLKNVTFTVQ